MYKDILNLHSEFTLGHSILDSLLGQAGVSGARVYCDVSTAETGVLFKTTTSSPKILEFEAPFAQEFETDLFLSALRFSFGALLCKDITDVRYRH